MNEREIFERALDLKTPAQRQAFLGQACGSDDAVRARIEALLASAESASQFLNEPALKQLRQPATDHTSRTEVFSTGAEAGELEPDDEDDSRAGPDLSFLQPSSKPGSIGALGHYEIVRVLGQGAFGIVFEAFDEKLHRLVAIKAMNPQLAATS